jgi:hypothetical protein
MKTFALVALALALSGCVSVSAWVRPAFGGRVVDANSEQPISGAQLSSQGGEILGRTGADGAFAIPAKKGKILICLLGATDTLAERVVLNVDAPGYDTLHFAPPNTWAVTDPKPVPLSLGILKLIKTPNHVPDPTSLSVAPPAGAGGAPSAAADH